MRGPRRARAPRRRQAPRRSVIARRRLPTNVPEIASCSEVLANVQAETNQMYGPEPVALSLFERASSIARNYQQYRITSVKWTFKPQFDTFLADTNASTSYKVPQFYHMLDKSQSIPLLTTINGLRAMGAKPRRFDDKNVIVTYSPGVLTSVQAPGVPELAMPKISPWLSTNATPSVAWAPSDILHNGIYYYLETGALPGDAQYEYNVDVEVQFQFRKPLVVERAQAIAPAMSVLRPASVPTA